MRINHNIASLNTYRQLTGNTGNTQKSLEKLSSGLRINRAGDDAAGLAISEKMRGQIRGLDQAGRNANDGISLIQTAEGALNETHSILQRMRELAVQSSNDTNTLGDRTEIQKEIDQLTTEITRISTDTEFNTKKLLNGDMGKTYVATTNTMAPTNLQVTGSDITTGTYTLTAAAGGTDTAVIGANTVAATLAVGDITAAAGTKYGDYTLQVVRGAGATADLTLTGPDGTVSTLSGSAITAGATLGGVTIAFNTHNMTLAPSTSGTLQFTLQNGGLQINLSGAKTVTTTAITAYKGETLNIGGFQFSETWGAAATNDTTVMNVNDASIKFHIGANQDQNTTLAVNNMSATALGVNSLVLTSQAGANTSITTINNALVTVSSERAKLGAMQNRLEHTINNLGTTSENLTASESRVRDVDMAKEMMEFTKNNILSQAAQAMLAQANQQPQGVLQLLR